MQDGMDTPAFVVLAVVHLREIILQYVRSGMLGMRGRGRPLLRSMPTRLVRCGAQIMLLT